MQYTDIFYVQELPKRRLHSIDRACAERFTGLAYIELHYITRQVRRADKSLRRIGKLRLCGSQQPRDSHSHIIWLGTLHSALLRHLRLAFDALIL